MTESELETRSEKKEDFFPDIPDTCDDDFAVLIQDCWKEKPSRRPNIFSAIIRLKEIERKITKTKK